MNEGSLNLIGTIVETEDHYGTCAVQIDWPGLEDHEHFPAEGRVWMPIPDIVENPSDIAGYEGRRVEVTIALLGDDPV